MSGDNPYQTTDTPNGWGGVVEEHVLGIAKFAEKHTGNEGEYTATLNDSKTADSFAVHAAVYSVALWEAVKQSLPDDILSWGLGNKLLPCPLPESINQWQATMLLMRPKHLRENPLPRGERLDYLLTRWTLSSWWQARAGAKQNSMEQWTDALRMLGYAETMNIASSILDFELFEVLVGPSPRTRTRKRIAPLSYFLLQYWMAWSLWQGEHSGNVALLKRRLGISFKKTTMSKAISKLNLKP